MNFSQPHFLIKQPLPQSQLILTMGIISLVSIFSCGCLGMIVGIIALVLSRDDKLLYRLTPEKYTLESNNQLKSGIILAWVSVVIIFILYFTFFIIVVTGNLDKLR